MYIYGLYIFIILYDVFIDDCAYVDIFIYMFVDGYIYVDRL